jgi:hypothetical protein
MKRIAAALLPLLASACTEAPTDSQLPSSGTAYVHTSNGILEIDYQRDGEHVIIQGDIAVGVDELLAATIDPVDLDDAIAGGRERGAVRALGRRRWPEGRVVFRRDANLSAAQVAAVNGAIAHWEANTPFRFVERTTETDFVTFAPGTAGGNCSSNVGRQGGEQLLQVGVCPQGNLIHEIGHLVGLWHEHSRWDRDAYIRVFEENLLPGYENALNTYIDDGRDGADTGDYDFASIMHFSTHAFSANGLPTIETTWVSNYPIGQRTGLSRGDRDAAIRLVSPGGTYDNGHYKIALYSEPNWQSTPQLVAPGFYSAANGQFETIGDNTTSSIRMFPGLVVEVWTGGPDEPRRYYAGQHATLEAPFDNSISAIRVERAVTVFRDRDEFSEISQTFRPGEYRASRGDFSVVGDNAISAVVVPPGLLVELCTSDTGGTCKTFYDDAFLDADLDNKVSMLRVKRGATVYGRDNLDTREGVRCFTPGTYSSSSFWPFPNNAISSIAVGDGLKATMCDSVNGTGTCEVFRGDVTYVGSGIDNRASWIKVEADTQP